MPSVKLQQLIGPKPNLGDKLRAAGIEDAQPVVGTVWGGPTDPGPRGGITQSLLSRWLCCRERARLLLVEGLSPEDQFSQRLEYGNMWHVCEEALAKGVDYKKPLIAYAESLANRYPTSMGQISRWTRICQLQFPIYVNWWKKHPEVTKRKPVMEEQIFCVPYKLLSGRTVYLRGKWDSVDYVPKDGVVLQENKSKGDVDEGEMKRNLTFDLQTGIYSVALTESMKVGKKGIEFHPTSEIGIQLYAVNPLGLSAIRYNVIRRPLAGGKHSIRLTKGKPDEGDIEKFYARLAELIEGAIEEDGSHYFFNRWRVDLLPGDIEKFKHTCLNPVLESLCDWWEWITKCIANNADPFGFCLGEPNRLHFRHPYGVYNVTLEGGSSELDEHLLSGSELGLRRVETLFPELEPVCLP